MDTSALTGFLASPSGVALKGLLVGSVLVALLGIFAALRDGTFDMKYIDSFVRTTVWGKVAPVGVVLVVGYVLNDDATNVIAIPIAGAVGLGMLKSALDSIGQLRVDKEASAERNTPPTG